MEWVREGYRSSSHSSPSTRDGISRDLDRQYEYDRGFYTPDMVGVGVGVGVKDMDEAILIPSSPSPSPNTSSKNVKQKEKQKEKEKESKIFVELMAYSILWWTLLGGCKVLGGGGGVSRRMVSLFVLFVLRSSFFILRSSSLILLFRSSFSSTHPVLSILTVYCSSTSPLHSPILDRTHPHPRQTSNTHSGYQHTTLPS